MATDAANTTANTHNTHAKYRKVELVPTNEHGQATKLYFCVCKATQIMTFHITWITFWLCFFVWFCTTNIYHQISADINLTFTQHQLAGSLCIASTIFFRLLASELCYKYGSRKSYVFILICTSLSLVGLALVQSATAYILLHVFLGIAGASFVITQYHTTRMFDDSIVGFAQAITAGFGNFGGGCANFIMPLLTYYIDISWRWYMVIFALILFLFCFIYHMQTSDCPEDQYGSRSLLSIIYTHDAEHTPSATPHAHGPPDKQIGLSFKDAATDYRTWILFFCYAACFGVEITFYLVAAHYFQEEFGLNEIMSGLIVMIWSSMNIFARPLGGYISDKYNMVKRVQILFVILFVESIFLILFGVIGHLSLYGAIISSILFSVCIQMAEGVTFTIVPFILPKCRSYVMGIVGSGGNFGAVAFIVVIFIPWNNANLDSQYEWVTLGFAVMIIAFVTLRIKFSERELHDLNQTRHECYDLEAIKTKRKNLAQLTPTERSGSEEKDALNFEVE